MRRGTSGLNLLLGIDKPAGLTSHDVVDRVRRSVGERRVGHAGTLDPGATGVMVVGVGQATRLMGLLTAERKSYLASIVFGSETETDDAEGAVVREAPADPRLLDPEVAAATLDALVGVREQVPPAYSAISVGGRRAYALAREGRPVELAAREVTIYAAQLLAVIEVGGAPVWQCAFEVSKGTYVRSIARDLGRDLGSAAHLGELRRTASGTTTLASCLTLDALAALGGAGVASRALDPVAALGLPSRHLSAREAQDAAQGKSLGLGVVEDGAGQRASGEGERVAIVSGGELRGVWRASHGRLVSDVNFPVGIVGVRG